MSSIFSTQNRHTFLRRKYCFFCVSTALSPPVGRCDALPGLPLDSAIINSFRTSSYQLSADSFLSCFLRLSQHLRRHRRLGRRRGRGGLPVRPLFAMLLALFQALQCFI